MKNKHFFIVGAQRSGTTYLYNLLDQHPEVCMSKPLVPEPKYFLDKEFKDVNLKNYHNSYFNNCDLLVKVYGEKSTSYYEKEKTAKLIYSVFPNSKIIFILRDPIQRAIDNYFFSVSHGLESRSLEDVFIKNIAKPSINKNISTDPFDYLSRGNYILFVQNYLKYFSRDEIKVYILENFSGKLKCIQEMYGFLGVNQSFTPNGLNDMVNTVDIKESASDDVLFFLKDYYKDSIIQLGELLGTDISMWS
ncbi:sulfotransferase [bacterium]|jgi:hypothetical protein|nr:sulfotransferase [bacterium]